MLNLDDIITACLAGLSGNARMSFSEQSKHLVKELNIHGYFILKPTTESAMLWLCQCALSDEIYVIDEKGSCELCEAKNREPLNAESVTKALKFYADRVKKNEELKVAVQSAFELLQIANNNGAFKNGVQSQGIDEGEVWASGILDQIQKALLL